MSASIAVIGGGAAGAACAFCLRRSGFEVTVFSHRAGATSLGSGALDAVPPGTRRGDEARVELEPLVFEFARALGIWSLAPCKVATRQGLVRSTLGRDEALLDLEPLRGRHIALADVGRDDWDAPGLARSLSASAWAVETSTTFEAVEIPALRRGAERRISPYDFAALHDHPERSGWLAGLLRDASRGVDAWLLGSWLGLEPGVPARVREIAGLPVGEVTSPLGGPAGARFDAASRRLFAETGVKQREQRVARVERSGTAWSVVLDEAEEKASLEFDAVVLAVGGVAAGGITLVTDPERGRNGFRLGLSAPARLLLDGEVAFQASSLYGADFEATGFGPLERVGIELTRENWAQSDAGAEVGLTAAGDCVAQRPRTLLEAMRSGCAAARTVTLRFSSP
jgi:glycerol-3-phosphate dehydrogenase subunit B